MATISSSVSQQLDSLNLPTSVMLLFVITIQLTSSSPVPITTPIKQPDSPIVAPVPTPPHCIPSSMTDFEAQLTIFTHHKSVDSCNEMVRKLNNAAPSINSSCPWDYSCDFKVNRFPQYIIQANCLKSHCNGGSCENENAVMEQLECIPVEVPLDVYECSEATPSLESIVQGGASEQAEGLWTKAHIVVGCQCDNLGKR